MHVAVSQCLHALLQLLFIVQVTNSAGSEQQSMDLLTCLRAMQVRCRCIT